MNEIKFKSLEDLYNRILPALKCEARELHKKGYNYIHEEDIWNYLKTYKWTSSRDLDLSAMVNDIFQIDIKLLDADVQDKIKNYHRKTYTRGDINEEL